MRPLTETRVVAAGADAEAMTETRRGRREGWMMSGKVDDDDDARLLGLAAAAARGLLMTLLLLLVLLETTAAALALLLLRLLQPRMSRRRERENENEREGEMSTTSRRAKKWKKNVHFFFPGKSKNPPEKTMPPSTRSTRSRSVIGASPGKSSTAATASKKK